MADNDLPKEDTDWIDDSIPDPSDEEFRDMNNKTEFKYIWTKKMVDGQIYGVRSDTEDELFADMEALEKRIADKTNSVGPTVFDNPPQNQPPKPSPQTRLMCNTCGMAAEMKTGTKKDGSIWRGVFCSSKIREHTKFLE